jgi:Mg-chelatase subunit ChlD
MRNSLVVVVAALASVAATRLVAMRVDVEPVRAIGPDTVMTIVLEVAPEDRERVGRDVLLRAELRRGDEVVSRVTRTVELVDGIARLDTPWPPGGYELRVDVEGVGRDANGFWRGRIQVPRLEPQEPVTTDEDLAGGPPSGVAAAGGVATGIASAAGDPPAPEAAAPTAEAPEAVADAPVVETPSGVEDGVATGELGPRTVAPAEVEAPEPATPPAEMTAWGAPAAGQTEVTVSVLEQARGVAGLGAPAFEVEVDGDPVTLAAVGGAGEAPLNLVLAVDVSASMTEHLPELRRQLTRLAFEATASGGGVAVVVADAAPERAVTWGGSADAVAEALAVPGSADASDLSRLVRDGLAAMSEAAGRRALVLVTDGGDTASRPEWSDAVDAAASAPGPVLVVAFRSDALDSRTARAVDRLADVSGGDSWSLRDTSLLEAVLDAYREHLAGAYALRFARPTETSRLRVDVAGGDWEVLHPERVR